MKQYFIPLTTYLILFFSNCSQIYSPDGISGRRAREEILEVFNATGFLPIIELRNVSFLPNEESIVCERPSTVINGGPTTAPGIFSLPERNQNIGLESIGNPNFFRSNIARENYLNNQITIKSIVTESQPTAGNSCKYKVDNNCNGNIIDSHIMFQISSVSYQVISLVVSECLIIKCEGDAFISVRNGPSEINVNSAFDYGGILLAPVLFEEFLEIRDDLDYTRQSVDSCKDSIAIISIEETLSTRRAISNFPVENTKAMQCNTPLPGLNLPNRILYTALKAETCNLKEVD